MAEQSSAVLSAYRTAARAYLPKERIPEAALGGVLTYIGRAERAIAAGDVAGAHEALVAAQQIVAVLRGSLDHAAGGALAQRLDSVYAYAMLELGRANLEKNAARLRALVPIIVPLHEAFGRAAAAEAPREALAGGGGRT